MYRMTFIFNISRIANFRSEAGNVSVEVSGIVNLKNYVSQTSIGLVAFLALKRADAETVTQ